MAEPKRTNSGIEDKFDTYLRERFAELKRELDAQLATGRPKAGALRAMTGQTGSATRRGWTVGIAALLLAAVAIPLMVQLNQQSAERRTAAVTMTPSAEPTERRKKSAQTAGVEARDAESSAGKSGRQRAATKTERLEENSSGAEQAGLAFRKRAQQTTVLEDNTEHPTESRETTAQAARTAPAAARVQNSAAEAPDTRAANSEGQTESSAAGGAPAMPEVKARSAPIQDANFRLRKAELDELEKKEMEQLWKEYEKDPKLFTKDRRKTERLKLLLARHDTRSRARRMLAQ